MLQSTELPEELNISLGSENREFAVKGTFAQPVIASALSILFGAGWLGFTFLLMSFFLAPGFFSHDGFVNHVCVVVVTAAFRLLCADFHFT